MIEPKDGKISVYRNPSNSNSVSMYFQCPITCQCSNDRCFWRQRDVHGLNAFPVWVDEKGNYPLMDENDKIVEKYGESVFPEFKVFVITNGLGLKCKEYVSVPNES